MGSAGRASPAGWDWAQLGVIALKEAQRVLRSQHDAEDAAQEAMIRAYRARARCDTPETPQAWVRTIARREAYRLHARPLPTPSDDLPEEGACGPDVSEDVLERLAATSLLCHFPHADRSLLHRRYVLGQTSGQIAEALQLPAATIRVRLHRAIKRLKERHEVLVDV